MKTKKDLKKLRALIKTALQSAREIFIVDKIEFKDKNLASYIAGYIGNNLEFKKQ